MISLTEFKKKYLGKTVGYPDGSYVGECLSLVKVYIKERYGINPPASGCNGARCYWSKFPDPLGKVFTKIVNTLDFTPLKGDIIVWNENAGKGYGHIAICTGNNTGLKYFESLDQNWGGRQAHLVRHNYTNVYGVLRGNDIIEEGNNPDMPTDIRLKILDEEGIKSESQVREAVARNKGWEALQNDKRNADIKIDLLQDEIKKLKSDLQAERDANVARVNAEKEQNRNLLKSIGEATGANQSLPEILQAISILRSAEQGKDKAERDAKQVREELNNEKLRHSKTSDKLQNTTSLLKGTESELKDVKKALERLTVINNKNNMAKKKLNPVLEALKEPLRLCVLAIVPALISYFSGMDAVWAVVATVLLKSLDKYLHKSGKLELGITRF